MSNLSKREKILLLTLLVLVIGTLYYKYIMIPQIEKFKAAAAILESNKKVLANLTEVKNNMDNLKNQYNDLNTQLQRYKESIPDTGRVPELVLLLKDMTDSSGCDGGRLLFGAPIKGEASQNNNINKSTNKQAAKELLTVIPMTYEIKGDYSNIMSLISMIEKSSRKMIVDKIWVSKDEETGKLSANININCFYFGAGNNQSVDYPSIKNSAGKYDIFN